MPKRLEENHHLYIDIKDGKKRLRSFGGYNGEKLEWTYQNEIYMIKSQEKNKSHQNFEGIAYKKINSYNNSIISEYIGSNLINYLNFNNIDAQKTFLIKENVLNEENNEKYKFWVACYHLEDNYDDGYRFFALSSLYPFKNGERNLNEQISRKQDNIKFNDMIKWIKDVGSSYLNIDQNDFIKYFYNMFILDAFLLNWDRNPTNWGFLINDEHEIIKSIFAPLIDQGSTLFAKQDDKNINKIDNQDFRTQVDEQIKNTKSFFLDENNKKIQYLEYLKKTKDDFLLKQLNLFLQHLKTINLDYFINTLVLDETYKQDYLYLITRNLELIHEYVNKNPLYKKIIKDNEFKR